MRAVASVPNKGSYSGEVRIESYKVPLTSVKDPHEMNCFTVRLTLPSSSDIGHITANTFELLSSHGGTVNEVTVEKAFYAKSGSQSTHYEFSASIAPEPTHEDIGEYERELVRTINLAFLLKDSPVFLRYGEKCSSIFCDFIAGNSPQPIREALKSEYEALLGLLPLRLNTGVNALPARAARFIDLRKLALTTLRFVDKTPPLFATLAKTNPKDVEDSRDYRSFTFQIRDDDTQARTGIDCERGLAINPIYNYTHISVFGIADKFQTATGLPFQLLTFSEDLFKKVFGVSLLDREYCISTR